MNGLQVIARADAVLRTLEVEETMTVPELAAALESPVSSTYRLLRRLTDAGWVEPAPARGEYRLGPYLLGVASRVERQLDLPALARPLMATLVDATGLAATLLVERGDRAVCVERRVPPAATALAPQIGDSLPLHAGAGALLLLAHLPDRERAEALEGGTAHERRLIPDDLEQQIVAARSQAPIRSHDALFGADTLAAPIWNHRGELVAALTLHGVLGDSGTISRQLAAAANDLCRGLGVGGGA